MDHHEKGRGEARVIARRCPTDFEASPGGVPLYSGTCSCCCCLHWVGALVGAGVGYARSDFKGQRAPVRRDCHLGFVLGLVVAVGLLLLAGYGDLDWMINLWVWPVIFVPFLFFIPSGVLLLLSSLRSRRVDPPRRSEFRDRDQRPAQEESLGAYRDAGAEERLTRDVDLYKQRSREELRFLSGAFGRLLGYSLLGTIAGYAIMVLLSLLL